MNDDSPRRQRWALIGLALAAFLVRVVPLIGPGGAVGFPIDYDEGVYFSASSLLIRGVLPYRDFIFVHPPGVLVLLAPFTALTHFLDPALVFSVIRFVVALIGALNVYLVGRIAGRWAGTWAAVFAAASYALYPELVVVERGPFLEAWLNFACLLFASLWLRPSPIQLSNRAAFLLGGLISVAVSIKLMGGIWALAALVTIPAARRLEIARWFVAGAALGALLLIGVAALSAPSQFVADVVTFHAQRPADGELSFIGRFQAMFGGHHRVGSALAILALAGVVVAGKEGRGRELAFFSLVGLVTPLAFLVTRSYWDQYNAFLAPSFSILAGVGFARVPSLLRMPSTRWAAGLVVGLAVLALSPNVPRLRENASVRAPQQVATGKMLRSIAPSRCVFSFEPGWAVVGGRLPPIIAGTPEPAPTVDPYAAMLMDAMAARSFANAAEAFQSAESQRRIRELMARCPVIVTGWRGDWQLNADSKAWIEAHFRKSFPAQGQLGIDVWESAR